LNLLRARNWKSKDFFIYVLTIQILLYVVMAINVPIARQVIGFLYLTFIPGMVILKLLKLRNLDWTETILLSVGLSLAFLMIAGLLINELSSLVGLSAPLSEVPLIVVISGVILLLSFFSFLTSKDYRFPVTGSFKFNLFALLFVCLPLLSVLGAIAVNAFGNNLILILMLLTVSVLIVLSTLSEKLFPPKIYPLALLMIAIALLFHTSLISNYIYGTDIQVEYHTFKLTQEDGYWSSTTFPDDPLFGRFNNMLSVTILPTVYSNILNLDGTWVLKIVFPLIFSLVPLGLFKLWQTNYGKKTAIISVFLLMSQSTFYGEMLGLARQMIAELFFVLLLLVLLSKKFDSRDSKVCFIIFSLALIVSHYSLALIFLFFILGAWLFMFFYKMKSRKSTLTFVVFFGVLMFSWYIYTSTSASFNSILLFGGYVYRRLGSFLNLESRGTEVMVGLGMGSVESYWQVLGRMFAYLTQLLIVVGFVALIARRKKTKLNQEYIIFSWFSMVLLATTILLPGFALTLNMTRFYHIILFFLAPFFVLGCKASIGFLTKRKTRLFVSILIVVVLVPYFLFQTNFVYEVVGSKSWSVPLSKYRMDRALLSAWAGLVDEQSVIGAQWISKNRDVRDVQIYADLASEKVLISYGMIHQDNINELSNATTMATDGILYLSTLNVVDGKILGINIDQFLNSSDLSSLFNDGNKVYSNGGCEIYVPHGSR